MVNTLSNINELKPISKLQYRKSTHSQAYFWWHSLKTKTQEKSEDAEFDSHDIDLDDYDEEFALLLPRELSERFSKSLQKINQWMIKCLQAKYDCVAITGNKQERIAKTLSLINSQKLLLNPIFSFKNAIAEPFAYDTKTNKLINFKYSAKVKRLDFLDGFFDYAIVSQTVPVSSYELWVPRDKNYTKFEIAMRPTEWGAVTLQGAAPLLKQGPKEMSFMEAFAREAINIKMGAKQPQYVPFPNISTRLDTIEKARDASLNKSDLKDDVSLHWGANAEWDLLLKTISSPYYGFSGKVYPKKTIAQHPLQLSLDSPVAKLLANLTAPQVDLKRLKNVLALNQNQVIVWYDFEGYALPFAPLDFAKPFQQIAFQVSVIKTNQLAELSVNNLVLDPLTLKAEDFHQIINAIYDPEAQFYVVYNKAYELTRLKEMHLMLEQTADTEANNFLTKYEHITNHTIDLYDYFKINSGNIIPPILLHDQRGRASIKNVELHINQNHIKMPRPIQKYYDLAVPNGTAAMTHAIDRALGLTGEQKWTQICNDLKAYCENDVRAMIMTFDYILMKAKP